jgi:Magnesium chelatase, subunit ChlI
VPFLDELPEFGQQTLDVLRQPLEDRIVTISRASGSLTFPANFTLIVAMNPCPRDYQGDPSETPDLSPWICRVCQYPHSVGQDSPIYEFATSISFGEGVLSYRSGTTKTPGSILGNDHQKWPRCVSN